MLLRSYIAIVRTEISLLTFGVSPALEELALMVSSSKGVNFSVKEFSLVALCELALFEKELD